MQQVAGGWGSQLQAHILNCKQEAGIGHLQWHMAVEIPKLTQCDILSPAKPTPLKLAQMAPLTGVKYSGS